MVPASWVAALLFVLFVAPGLVFDLLSQRRRAGPTESTFREISRVVLASTCFSGITLVILSAVRAWAAPWWLPDPGMLVRDGVRYSQTNYPILTWTLAGGVAFAVLLAVSAHYFLARGDGASIKQHSAWTRAFRDDVPAGHFPYARVRLDDDTVYGGKVAAFSPGLEMEDREILLMGPHLIFKKREGQASPVPADYERVVISESQIRAISVSYWPESSPPPASPSPLPGPPVPTPGAPAP